MTKLGIDKESLIKQIYNIKRVLEKKAFMITNTQNKDRLQKCILFLC